MKLRSKFGNLSKNANFVLFSEKKIVTGGRDGRDEYQLCGP